LFFFLLIPTKIIIKLPTSHLWEDEGAMLFSIFMI